ncbi:MAG: peptide-methionine (S)-S-oxide reductase MsrA [Hyphomicrobiaceae bacterium]|nr:peptide-methionine (S)-S-oxide reductase MsrA [Hyphomicrobiaceae bacterium]
MPTLTRRRHGALLALALLLGFAASTSRAQAPAALETAVFAGGCFWCVEEAFEKVPGVLSAVSGYIGGTVANPTYEQVAAKATGHAEAVEVTYDPGKVSYAQLVDWFWRNIDPFDERGQFCDKGSPYRSGIHYRGEAQRKEAEASKAALEASGRFKQRIVTEIVPAATFYPAETYHQDYYKKNPNRYQYYKYGCGRAARLEQIWGKPEPPKGPTQ